MNEVQGQVNHSNSMAQAAEQLASRFADDALAGQEQLASQLKQ